MWCAAPYDPLFVGLRTGFFSRERDMYTGKELTAE
jgi:hypothetical protein